jgi:isocitrate dehydrogenase
LRWDSLGEYLALAVSIEELADKTGNDKARIVGNALNDANGRYLSENRSPSRKVNELDNRGSTFYLAMYWAQAVAEQTDDSALAEKFSAVASALAENESAIVEELNAAQGQAVDTGGYYNPNDDMAGAAMRPSATLNAIIDTIS